jgi:DNA-directed RNA polymerase specialized sigma24 family protein
MFPLNVVTYGRDRHDHFSSAIVTILSRRRDPGGRVAPTVPDPQPPSFDGIRKELEKASVRARLKWLATRYTATDADAEDLVQQALARVVDPQGSPWDPDGTTTFVNHVGSVINGLASNEWRSARVRHEILDGHLAHDGQTADDAPAVDAILEEREEQETLRRRGVKLLACLGDTDPVATDVLAAAREGFETPAEQAARLGRKVEDVYEAYRRLKYHAAQILAQEGGPDSEPSRGLANKAAKQEVAK